MTQKMNNYEKIKNMSIEEMAEFFQITFDPTNRWKYHKMATTGGKLMTTNITRNKECEAM